jgi:hypothetical protein
MPRSVLFHQNYSTVYKTADATALDHQNGHSFWAVLPEWSNVDMLRGLALGSILHDPQLGRKYRGMVILPKLSCEQLCTRMCSGLTSLKQVETQLGLGKDVIFTTIAARHIPKSLTFRFMMDKEEFNIVDMHLGDVISSEHPSIFISDTRTEAIKSVQSVEAPMPGSEKDVKYPPSLPLRAHKPRTEKPAVSAVDLANNATPAKPHASTER